VLTVFLSQYIAYRNLVDVAYTEAEMKEIAADVEVEDGPDDVGEMFQRPGKLADHIPAPYPNENAARAANNGAYPVDLSLVVKARPGGEDYLFSLLTGYKEPPAGIEVKPGMSYNPYFPGGQIAMPQQLTNDMVEYEDGTDASVSQLAKDVTTFLTWASEPHQDAHKLYGLKGIFLASLFLAQLVYWKRFKWSIFKMRRISFTKADPFNGKH
jgi:ubiquinol-cytochrome c reductase cytochrome c1 subunit